jgi:hypothetical protein
MAKFLSDSISAVLYDGDALNKYVWNGHEDASW